MPVVRPHRGLYVVEDSLDATAIGRELAAVDDRLFLSWDVEQGRQLWRVLYDRGDLPPVAIADWRDDRGRPLPLSSGLLELVKSLRPRGGPDLEASSRANAAARERQLRDFDEAVDEIAADIGPRISDKRSAVLHRGPHLRRARSSQ